METIYSKEKVKEIRKLLTEKNALEEMRGVFLINNISKMERELSELLAEENVKKARKTAKKDVPSKKKKK